MGKFLKTVLIAAVVVAVGAVVVAMLPDDAVNNQSDNAATDTAVTTDFSNTYTAEDTSLTFSYPDQAEVSTEAGLAKVQILGDGNEPATEVTDGITGYIMVKDVPAESDFDTFTASEFEAKSDTAASVTAEPTDGEFAGSGGQTFTLENQLGSQTTYYILETDAQDTALVVSYVASGPEAESYVEDFAEIVETATVSADANGETDDSSAATGSDEDQATADEPDGEEEMSTLAQSCTDAGGNWLAEHQECEYISESWCSSEGGEFQECASACRHDEEAQVCTMQCVSVCSFN